MQRVGENGSEDDTGYHGRISIDLSNLGCSSYLESRKNTNSTNPKSEEEKKSISDATEFMR